MDLESILALFTQLGNPLAAEGMAKYGITAQKIYGVSIPALRRLAKQLGMNHTLAQKLWMVNSRESRIFASMIANPHIVSESLLDAWVNDFDSWEVCDQCCMNLIEITQFAVPKSLEWSARDKEFVKRAGFVLMARLAVSNKHAENALFTRFFPIIYRESQDNRNYVKKAINWALRQIGKRDLELNTEAIKMAEAIQNLDSKSARWIAKDALRELKNPQIQARIKQKP
ncbi:DNA alkylation repair protein [bacterium]|nr:DNA alkylation repair protein [bacterium]